MLFFSLLLMVLTAIPAHAEDQVFKVAIDQGNDILANMQPIMEGLGILGMLGVGAMAFSGRMPWGWAFGLIGGLTLAWLAVPLSTWVVEVAQAEQATDFAGVASGVNKAGHALHADAKNLLYVISGMFIVGAGVMAGFRQIPWSWFFSLSGGLMIIGSSVELVSYFVGTSDDIGFASTPQTIATSAFLGTERIVYGIAGISALGIGTVAMMGRWRWDLFFGLVGGLAFVASITLMMDYVAGVQPY